MNCNLIGKAGDLLDGKITESILDKCIDNSTDEMKKDTIFYLLGYIGGLQGIE